MIYAKKHCIRLSINWRANTFMKIVNQLIYYLEQLMANQHEEGADPSIHLHSLLSTVQARAPGQEMELSLPDYCVLAPGPGRHPGWEDWMSPSLHVGTSPEDSGIFLNFFKNFIMKIVKHMKSTININYLQQLSIYAQFYFIYAPCLDYCKANPRLPIISSIIIQYISLKERDF